MMKKTTNMKHRGGRKSPDAKAVLLDRRTVLCGAAASLALPGASSAQVPAPRPTFGTLWSSYPHSDRETFYNALGGQWPTLVDHPDYLNTCCVRASVALAGAGSPIPTAYRQAIAGDGRSLILQVRAMSDYLTLLLGQPSWGMSKGATDSVELPVRNAIILYHANYDDAAGHVDLWNGVQFAGQLDIWEGIEMPGGSNMNAINTKAFQIAMWFLD